MSRPPYRSTHGVAVRLNQLGQTEYLCGSMNADMSMAIQLRIGMPFPDRLFAGLMRKGPDPDGFGHEEVVAEGYQRQQVQLAPHSRSRLAVPHQVKFEWSAPAVVTHVGLFGAENGGELLWFGGLRGSRYASSPPRRIELPAFRLTATRPANAVESPMPGVVGA